MVLNIILLFLFAGLPYYIFFEKTKTLKHETVFLLTAFFFLCAIIIASCFKSEHSQVITVISLLTSVFTIYKASKTTNLYKVSYYIFFINAPVLIMFDAAQNVPYAISLLITLVGMYFIAKYYERNYGSANYLPITGTTIATPYAGIALTMYIITLALYPPFPNSILFLSSILDADVDALWYVTVLVIFFGNFVVAMRIMSKTLFGKPNSSIHYIDLPKKDMFIHFFIIIALFALSAWGFKEVLA